MDEDSLCKILCKTITSEAYICQVDHPNDDGITRHSSPNKTGHPDKNKDAFIVYEKLYEHPDIMFENGRLVFAKVMSIGVDRRRHCIQTTIKRPANYREQPENSQTCRALLLL